MLPRNMGLRGTPSAMQHAVMLSRDSWMRFNYRTYRSLPPRLTDHRIFGELELSHHAPAGVQAYAVNPVASGGGFHLCCLLYTSDAADE